MARSGVRVHSGSVWTRMHVSTRDNASEQKARPP